MTVPYAALESQAEKEAVRAYELVFGAVGHE
jgi:hypothetical protein